MNKMILGAIAAVFIVMPASIILIPHGSECYEYNWEYDGRSYSMKYDCDPQLLDEYREQIHDRIPLGSYEKKGELFRKYIAESVTEKYLTGLVERLRGIYNDGDDLDLFIRSFVIENFDYCPDYINYGIFDWIAYPCETMEKGSGDCEDLGILLLSLLKTAGYDCGFVLFDDHFLPIASGIVSDHPVDDGLSQFSIIVDGREYIAFETSYGPSCPAGYTDSKYSSKNIIIVKIL